MGSSDKMARMLDSENGQSDKEGLNQGSSEQTL